MSMLRNYSLLKQLFMEVQKENREFLYNNRLKGFKNNKLKQIIWNEIALSLKMDKQQIQLLWKRAKAKYKEALERMNSPSGSGSQPQKALDNFLIKELEFLRDFINNDDNSLGIHAVSDQVVAECNVEITTDESSSSPQPPVRKKKKYKDEIIKSFGMLEKIAANLIQTPRDTFFDYLESEMTKLPNKVNIELKASFLQQVYEAQKRNINDKK